MIKRSMLAMAIAIVAPLAIATAEETVASPVLPSASALKASSASAGRRHVTNAPSVRIHVARRKPENNGSGNVDRARFGG